LNSRPIACHVTLEFAADDAHDALKNLLFNLGDLAAQVAAFATASEE
jgi:hypothetical protein